MSFQAALDRERFPATELRLVPQTRARSTGVGSRGWGEWVDRDALKDIAPVLVGLLPFAMVIGVAMREAGIPFLAAVVGSALAFTGTAHLAAVTLFGAGAGFATILMSAALINARLLLYGARIEPRFRDQPAWFRWLAPHFLIDQNFVLSEARPELDEPRRFRRYWLTGATAIAIMWLGTIAVTMGIGRVLPAHSPLEFASTGILVALLVPRLVEGRARAAALGAVIGALAGASLPNGLGLLVGIGFGLLAAELIRRRNS